MHQFPCLFQNDKHSKSDTRFIRLTSDAKNYSNQYRFTFMAHSKNINNKRYICTAIQFRCKFFRNHLHTSKITRKIKCGNNEIHLKYTYKKKNVAKPWTSIKILHVSQGAKLIAWPWIFDDSSLIIIKNYCIFHATSKMRYYIFTSQVWIYNFHFQFNSNIKSTDRFAFVKIFNKTITFQKINCKILYHRIQQSNYIFCHHFSICIVI